MSTHFAGLSLQSDMSICVLAPEFSTCMYSIYRVEIFYQFLQCTVPDKFEHDSNFVPFILFYTLKLKHNYNELSRGVS